PDCANWPRYLLTQLLGRSAECGELGADLSNVLGEVGEGCLVGGNGVAVVERRRRCAAWRDVDHRHSDQTATRPDLRVGIPPHVGKRLGEKLGGDEQTLR